ncbi:MAG TPA: DUF3891 family protein [Bacillales bacterium]|nr:DUF3891 family protein [Bacillales bacterium]
MIIQDNGRFFTFVRQHDHGLLSGEIAAHWGNSIFTIPKHNLVMTTALHDLSWIESDRILQWNNKENRPHDFTSLPIKAKLPMYQEGLNRTERLNPYGALLTSKHYCSFLRKGQDRSIDRFLQEEQNRRERLRLNLTYFGDSLDSDLRNLQLWDNLSLYVCLNRPGAKKNEEHPWFRNGIKAVSKMGESVKIHLRWLNERTISLKPFPFGESWSTTFPRSKVRKSLGTADPDTGNKIHQHICFIPG